MNKREPLVSVITTVYNTEKYLDRCFLSILNQTYRNIEFIVVDNGSKGNIQEIVEDYRVAFPNRKIILVSLKENIGLFKGRLAGVKKAEGDYVAFIDSDDRVSLDFYRVLVSLAEESKADMAASDVIIEFPDKSLVYENLNPYHLHNIDLCDDEISDLYWKQEGLCYYYHLVWNKIYSKKLIELSLPLLNKQKEHVVMCDDMAFSTVFFSYSKRFVSSNFVQYYYYKRADAYTSKSGSYDVYVSNLKNIKEVFGYMSYVQEYCGVSRKYSDCLNKWKNRYFRSWEKKIDSSELSIVQKNKLLNNNLIEALGEKKTNVEEDDQFFYQISENYYPFIEEYVKKIKQKNITTVSFDVFDTLLLRPLWDPSDLFMLMNDYLKKLLNPIMQPDFFSIRQFSEKIARENAKKESNYDEVSLDEIYDTMQEIYGYSKEVVDCLKREEIRLELEMTQVRQLGKYLYDLASYLNKKVFLISDMYLPEKVISSMLKKTGYINYLNLYVSSTYRITKYNGDLFRYILKKEKISKKEIVHVGDNYHSDIDIPNEMGIQTLHTPKVGEVWLTPTDNIFTSNYYFRCFNDSSRMLPNSTTMFVSTRMALAVAANKMYDNPFRNYKKGSDFNANPYDMGYSLLGPYLLGVCQWLYQNVRKNNYDCIHFIARDGYLLKEAFDSLQSFFGDYQVKTNYLRVSRKALIPLMIDNVWDLDNLEVVLDYRKHSPGSILRMLNQVIYVSNDELQEERMEGIILNKKFNSYNEYLKFIQVIKHRFKNSSKISSYRDRMTSYFNEIIGEHDCIFDVGYSGRTESILGKLLNKKIDTFYLNTTTQMGLDNARVNGFDLNMFINYLPLLSGPVREFLLSENASSCIGFEINEDEVVPIFEQEDSGFVKSFIVSLLQKGAIDYVKKIGSSFGKELQHVSFRVNDLCWPLEYFLLSASHNDLMIFNGIYFEDDLFLGKKQNIAEYWKNNQPVSKESFSNLYNTKGKFVQFITLFVYDRLSWKKKISKKLSGHPALLHIGTVGYRICRKMYRMFRKITFRA